jgi:hypothetical protein
MELERLCAALGVALPAAAAPPRSPCGTSLALAAPPHAPALDEDDLYGDLFPGGAPCDATATITLHAAVHAEEAKEVRFGERGRRGRGGP